MSKDEKRIGKGNVFRRFYREGKECRKVYILSKSAKEEEREYRKGNCLEDSVVKKVMS